MTKPKWWTVRELALYYRVTERKIRKDIASGKLHAQRSPYRVRDDWRLEWERAREAKPEIESKPVVVVGIRPYRPKILSR